MPWQANPYTLPLVLGGALSLALAGFGWSRRRSVPGVAFAGLMLAVGLWSVAYGLELASADLRVKLFWADVVYFGIVGVPAFWLVFALQNGGHGHRVTRRALALLAIEPVLTLTLVWTSDAHTLFRTNHHLVFSGSAAFLVSDKGPAFWVHTAYSYLLLLAGSVLIVAAGRGPRLYRGQSALVLAAGLTPWLGNAFYLSGASPFGPLDLSPFGFIATGLLMASGLLRFGLLDIVPVAREKVVEEMADGVVVVDAQGRIVDLNPAARAIIGPRADDAVGRPAAQVFASWPELVGRYRHVLEAIDEVAVGEGGDRRAYELRISPLKDARGRLTARVIAFRDVSERARAEDALQRSEARYRDLFEQSLGLICTHDLEGRLLSVNPAAAAALGYSPAEMVGRNLREFLAEAMRDRFDDYLAVFGQEPSAAGTMRIMNRQGEERLWRYRNVLLRETSGAAHVIGFAQDITDEARAQKALRDSEERFRQLAENIDAAFWMRSLAPARFLYVSPAYERIWGRSRRGLLDDPNAFLESVHPEDRGALEAALRRPVPCEIEHRIVRPDGGVRWIRSRGFPVRDPSGSVRRIAGVSEDVTELRAAEALREDLTRTMVHDLRSPLTVIKAFLDLLEASGTLTEGERGMHRTAEVSSIKLLRLIDSILDVSRLEKGGMPLHRRHVPLASLAAEVMDAEAFLAREKEVRLVNEVPRGLPPAWADPDVVGRVLQNLVGNAIKFTPRGGVVRVGACPDGSAVADLRVSVVDTGAGIAADVRGRLFQTFVTGQQEGRGSGLGLAFCRLAVEAHGGRIWSEDPPGGGAAFHFTLPTAPPEA